jgi:hypothetical protein
MDSGQPLGPNRSVILFGALFGFEPVQPTEWARLTVLHYGLESVIWLQHALIDSPIRTVK